jgi:hypothetical protein
MSAMDLDPAVRRIYFPSAARGVLRKPMAIWLSAFIRLIAMVRSTRSRSSKTERAAA